MNDTRAIIERVRRINAHYQYIELALEEDVPRRLKPGESLLVRLGAPDAQQDHWYPYLRERWWPVGFTNEQLLLIEAPYRERYRPQQVVTALGPVGKPFRFRPSLRNVLLIAHDSVPTPLTSMINQLLHNNISVTLVLLGSARHYQTDHLPPQLEVIRGDEVGFDWEGQLMTLGWADQIFVVVAQDDELLRFREVLQRVEELRGSVAENYIFGVFQLLLPCGVGACTACMLRVGGELLTACTKGPAFDLTKVTLPR